MAGEGRRVALAMVTNIPAPYRVPVMNRLAATPGIDLHVFYADRREPDRAWDLPELAHPHTFLRSNFRERDGRFIHNNPDVFAALRGFRPDVVVTTGFNPTHLYAFGYAQVFRRPHVAMTDGTATSEAGLSNAHRWIRRRVFARSPTFVAASHGGRDLFRSYGVADDRIFFSQLCANTTVQWTGAAPVSPGLDLLFSGRLVDIKNPLLALDIAHGVAVRLGRRVAIGMLGSGPLEGALRERAQALAPHVELRLAGHVDQAAIPGWFASARVFLFPTAWDPWGVVANEACMAGLPIVVSPHAGVTGELVQDGINGFVRRLDLASWVDATAALLSDESLHARMSRESVRLVQPYNFDNAARGIDEAVRRAAPKSSTKSGRGR